MQTIEPASPREQATLAAEGIETDVVDPRWTAPLDSRIPAAPVPQQALISAADAIAAAVRRAVDA